MRLSNRTTLSRRTRYAVLAAVVFGVGISVTAEAFAGDRHGQYLSRRDTIALGAGDAPRSNTAIHTIDPWPWYSKNDRLQFDGQRIDLGFTRYQANESIEPEGIATSDVGAGTGASTGTAR